MRIALLLLLLGPLVDLDHRLERGIQSLRRPAFETPMRAATDFAKPKVVLAGLIALAVLVRPAGAPAVVVALVALAPTNLAVEALKHGVGRVRPDGDRNRKNSSFPSSHAANAAAIATVLARRFRKASIPLLLIAATVAFSRLYLNRHYPSDVLAAVTIGAVSAWVTDRWLSRRWAWFRPCAPGAEVGEAVGSRGGGDSAGGGGEGLLR